MSLNNISSNVPESNDSGVSSIETLDPLDVSKGSLKEGIIY